MGECTSSKYAIDKIDPDSDPDSFIERLDLCPDCSIQLVEFLKGDQGKTANPERRRINRKDKPPKAVRTDRKIRIDFDKYDELIAKGTRKPEIAKQFGISLATLYNRLNGRGKTQADKTDTTTKRAGKIKKEPTPTKSPPSRPLTREQERERHLKHLQKDDDYMADHYASLESPKAEPDKCVLCQERDCMAGSDMCEDCYANHQTKKQEADQVEKALSTR